VCDPDLDGIGQPGLDADVHEAELGVDLIEVVVHALALTAASYEAMSVGIGLDVERPGRLHDGDHTDQPLGDPITIGDGAA
jgi:hypothetical protein